MKFSILIPCYNEKDNIDNLLSNIMPLQEKYDIEYVLIENGSKDGSRDYFRQNIEGKYKNISVAYIDENRGYGYGLQKGLLTAMGDYIGWIHADLQMHPAELVQFFDYINNSCSTKLFMKGIRTNRSLFDRFFTFGQSVFNSCLFGMKLFDVGAIPVLFHKSLLQNFEIEEMPNDFSIELYIYEKAIEYGFKTKRFVVRLQSREKGRSSWNTGLVSKFRQSKRIFYDSLKIKKGAKVL